MYFIFIEKKIGWEEKVIYLFFLFSVRFVMVKEFKFEDDLFIFF